MFNLQLAEGRTFATHTETIDYLASQHFKTIPHKRLSKPADILAELVFKLALVGALEDNLPQLQKKNFVHFDSFLYAINPVLPENSQNPG